MRSRAPPKSSHIALEGPQITQECFKIPPEHTSIIPAAPVNLAILVLVSVSRLQDTCVQSGASAYLPRPSYVEFVHQQ